MCNVLVAIPGACVTKFGSILLKFKEVGQLKIIFQNLLKGYVYTDEFYYKEHPTEMS